ncbi:MAG: ABC transporter ATP-binding protein [Bacilli bacterium]|nr:ABC transporter ATP-binding protein [Bacilli bacterium]
MHNRLNGEHAKNFKASLGKALRFNKKFVLPIIIALILSFASSILAIIGPDKLKEITDIITKGIGSSIDMEAIKHISLILVIMYALSFIFNYLQGYIMAVVTNIFSKDMRMTISEKINKLPLSYFDKVTVGDVLSRVTNDVDTIGFTLNQSLGTLVSAATMFIGSLFMMFTTSYLLALVAIFSTVFGFVLMGVIMKKSQKYFYSVQKGLGNIDGYIEEMFNGHNIVKVYNAEEDTNKEFDQINEKLWKDSLKSQFYSGLMHPIMHFTGNFGYVMVCVVGAILTMKGTITFGVIVAFMIYIRLFTNPLSQFASSMTQLQATAAASERVFEFLEEKEMSEEKDFVKLRKKDVVGDLEFKNIKFGYGKKTIIKGFNAKVKAAQKIAIVGPTGAGKTTIVNLLMKFYNPNSGDIIIDGVPISKITRENVHELFTMVLQDTWLFKGTIKENIRYNNTSISDKEIYDICKKIGLDHFIKTLPKGYDTVIDNSDSLSSGQKQLLTIARSMCEDTPFLILDEATSNVDTRTEELVSKAIDKLSKNKTSFIIAHRLSTIKNADLILVMNEGDIVEQGNHEELLKKNGFYAELYNSQFEI